MGNIRMTTLSRNIFFRINRNRCDPVFQSKAILIQRQKLFQIRMQQNSRNVRKFCSFCMRPNVRCILLDDRCQVAQSCQCLFLDSELFNPDLARITPDVDRSGAAPKLERNWPDLGENWSLNARFQKRQKTYSVRLVEVTLKPLSKLYLQNSRWSSF